MVLSRQRLDLFKDFCSLDLTYHTLSRQTTQPTFIVKTHIITKRIKKNESSRPDNYPYRHIFTSNGIIATSVGEFAKWCHLKDFLLLYSGLNLCSVSRTKNIYLQ